MTLNNPVSEAADASPYPSHVFVSGLTGTLSDLSVTLKEVSYSESQDIDALLVGPGGRLDPRGRRRPELGRGLSGVTLTLDDPSASTLAERAIWGSPGSTVFSSRSTTAA